VETDCRSDDTACLCAAVDFQTTDTDLKRCINMRCDDALSAAEDTKLYIAQVCAMPRPSNDSRLSDPPTPTLAGTSIAPTKTASRAPTSTLTEVGTESTESRRASSAFVAHQVPSDDTTNIRYFIGRHHPMGHYRRRYWGCVLYCIFCGGVHQYSAKTAQDSSSEGGLSSSLRGIPG